MKFSILMPTYNRPEFIKKAIASVLKQTHKDWELIIQNGGEQIEVPKDDRIRLFNEKDKGITDAMNKAMKKAIGDVFVWANDDDELVEDALEFINDNLRGLKWAYGKILRRNGNNTYEYGKSWNYDELKKHNIVPQPAVYWKKEVYDELGEMDEEQDLTSDYEYWLRIGSKYEPQFFDRILAIYNEHDGQITNKIQDEQLKQAELTKKKYEHIIR